MKFLIFFLLIGTAFANSSNKEIITANLNDYIDSVIPSIVEFMAGNGFDPMEIPDLCDGFSVKPLFITYHGELELTKGSLTGLTSLARYGDFTVSYIGKLLRVKGDFEFKNIGFTYRYLAKVMDIGPKGGVIGKVSRIGGAADILIDFNNNEIHLQDFYLHDVGRITVKLTGNILTDWLANALVNTITLLFKNVIMNIVESNLKTALQNYIDQINNAMGGGGSLIAFEKMAHEYQKLQAVPQYAYPVY